MDASDILTWVADCLNGGKEHERMEGDALAGIGPE